VESRWCRFRLLRANSPLRHTTNDSAALPQVAVTGAGGCLGVATVVLRLSLPLSRLGGWAARRDKAPPGWGTCVVGVSVAGVGGDGRWHCSSPPVPPPPHTAGAATGMCRAATQPHCSATSGRGERPVRLFAFWSYLPPPPPTDDSATWLLVAVTVAGGWRGVAVVLLPFFFASLWLEGGGHATGDGVVAVGYLSFLVHLRGGRR